jgi:iron-sulfur cluster repair protein YtfE (RIC family)
MRSFRQEAHDTQSLAEEPKPPMPQTIQLDRSMTINEIIARYPQTMPVFNEFGMDTCCGGGATVEEAAARDGLDADSVITALNKAAETDR